MTTEIVSPYLECAAAQAHRHVELVQHVGKIRANRAINAFRSVYDPLGLARVNLDASAKAVNALAETTKEELLAFVDLIRGIYVGTVRVGITPRSLLASHRVEKNLARILPTASRQLQRPAL